MWRAKAPDPEEVKQLDTERTRHDLTPLVIHDSYLINLAAPASDFREKSIDAFCGELERALIIGADYLVAHPGNYKGLTVEQGILNVAEALALAWRSVDERLTRNPKLTILLENTAGAGAQLGGHLQELGTIQQLASPYVDIRIGFCLDTCHCYASGFDLAKKSGLDELVKRAETDLGLSNVPVFHANDSKTGLGSHLDRHAHIGKGNIGVEGFRRILNHPKLRSKAFILETPLDEPGDDLRNVQALQSLVNAGGRKPASKYAQKRIAR